MNNAIQDVNISARELCKKLTEELGPMETEREHRINSIIIEMAQSSVEKVSVFQSKYLLTGTFHTNGDYQIVFPLGLNMTEAGAFPGLKWNEDYEQYSFSFSTDNCDHIRTFLELLMVSFVFGFAQHKLIPQFDDYIRDFYNTFLAKEMTPTLKDYYIATEWYGDSRYDGTTLKLVRRGDSWGYES